MCGSKLLFFCTIRGFSGGFAGELGVAVVASPDAPVIGVIHTTVPGIAPCRVLPAPPAPMTSTRPRTVVVVACACNPAAPAHNIATQIKILLWFIVDSSSDGSSQLLTMPLPSISSKKNSHHQIEVPRAVSAVGNRIRRQVSILSGK